MGNHGSTGRTKPLREDLLQLQDTAGPETSPSHRQGYAFPLHLTQQPTFNAAFPPRLSSLRHPCTTRCPSTSHNRSFLPCSATGELRLPSPFTDERCTSKRSLPTATMDFAPYQSSPPENSRPLSPRSPLASPRQSVDRRPFSPPRASPPPLHHPQPQRGWQPSIPGTYSGADAHREGVSEFDTSLGVRLDYEACAAYLALPPMGAILLLILERKSDYVR